MSHLLDENDELLASPAREMTLGTGAILGIFVGLTLLCALFFGFGYNLGHKAGSNALLAAAPEAASSLPSANPPSSSPGDTFKSFKRSTVKASPSAAAPDNEEAIEPAAASASTPSGHTTAVPVSVPHTAAPVRPEPSPRPIPGAAAASHSSVEAAAPPLPSTAPMGPAGTFFVQVAAVSHPEDASLLMGALRARGYAVAQRSESADKLIHIQVGPFPSKPTAEAMRQRLQGDGYNAIIK